MVIAVPMSIAPRPSRRPSMRASQSLPAIHAVGQKLSPHEDFYHWVLTLSWRAFFVWVTVAFLITNLVFGTAYSLAPNSVANASDFLDNFFFSVETLTTIGYGEMTPVGRLGHAIMTVEALVGLVATASITGITFARLARPTAKILFSEKAVVATRNGVPHLMFRMANWRRNQIVEAQLAVIVLVVETTREGETMRRPITLKLVRDRNPVFLLSWTAMHAIDADSPFYGDGALEKLRAMKAEIYLSLSGLDDTLAQTIHTRYRYSLDDIVYNARFTDVLTIRDDGVRVIDFDRFHEVETVDPPARPAERA